MLALDTETEAFVPGTMAPPIVCVSIASESHAGLLHHHEAAGVLFELLPRARWVGHYIAYDMACIIATWPVLTPLVFEAYEQGRIEDTALNTKLRDIALGWVARDYSLARLASRYLTRPMAEKESPWRLRYAELRDYPLERWPADAKAYATDDARVTWDIQRELTARGLSPDRFRQARADFWLKLCSNRGLVTDSAAVEAYGRRLEAERDALSAELTAAGLLRPNGTRDVGAAQARVASCWPNVEIPRTNTGKIATSRDVLKRAPDPLLHRYCDHSALAKKIGTDLPLLSVPIVHTRFDALKETGRTGSSRPNIQNLDRRSGARECFRPRDGFCYAIADYGKGELCTWAQVCIWVVGFSRLAELLNAGLDPHLEVASRIVGQPYEWCLEHIQDRAVDDARQTGKVANFGFPGGMGIERFVDYALKQYDVTISHDQARALKQTWRAALPEAGAYFALIDKLGDTVTHFVSGRVRGGLGYTQACNTFFQGLLADVAKDAGFRIARACWNDRASPLYGSRVVNFAHDEFITEVPLDRAHDAAHEQARFMNEAAAYWVPDVRLRAEPYLSTRWSKKARAVHGPDGRLVPWI